MDGLAQWARKHREPNAHIRAERLLLLLLLLLMFAGRYGCVLAASDRESHQALSAFNKQEASHQQYNLTEEAGRDPADEWEIIPDARLEDQILNMSSSSSRRKLGSFQICALCTCCGGRRRFCIPSACCYTIACGSPNRPFGFCSFRPVSCNCLQCRL